MTTEPVLLIFYDHAWGSHIGDRRFWTARLEDRAEVWDYGTRKQLEQQAQNEGLKFKTIRHHKNGKTSVLASNF